MSPNFCTGGAGCAVITPLRAPGLRAAIERTARRVDEALSAALRRTRRRIQVYPSVDGETLRDLGVSHTALLFAGFTCRPGRAAAAAPMPDLTVMSRLALRRVDAPGAIREPQGLRSDRNPFRHHPTSSSP